MLISLFTLRNKWLPGFVRPIDLHFVYFSSFVLVRLVEDVSSFSFLSDPETRWTDKEVHFSPQSPHPSPHARAERPALFPVGPAWISHVRDLHGRVCGGREEASAVRRDDVE